MTRKTFNDYLAHKQEEQGRERREREAIDARIAVERDKAIQREESLGKEKAIAAKTIFTFAKAFDKDELCGRIRDVHDTASVYLFGAGAWAHELPCKTWFGCWSRIQLNDKKLDYTSGYKWMGGSPARKFASESQLVVLAHDYLAQFADEIKTGKIYERIEKWYCRK